MLPKKKRYIEGSIRIPGPIGWLLSMADSGGIPGKLLPAIRAAAFWGALPFILLLVGIERFFDQHGNRYEVAACFFFAFLSILVAVYWERLLPARFRPKSPKIEYLQNEDSELGWAIIAMAWHSAWAKWYASQSLATNNHRPADETRIMRAASFLVHQALVDGHLEARGRRPGELDYKPIPQTHWRSTVPHMVPDPKSLWRMILMPTGGAEFDRDGNLVRADHLPSKERTDQLVGYDSIIVNARQFESLWPRKDKKTDAARARLLKKAKKAGADPAEIEKLARD